MAKIKLGRRDAKVDASAHTPGIRQGNAPGGYERQKGHKADGSSTAARSTGINPDARDPIDPRMPNLSPG